MVLRPVVARFNVDGRSKLETAERDNELSLRREVWYFWEPAVVDCPNGSFVA